MVVSTYYASALTAASIFALSAYAAMASAQAADSCVQSEATMAKDDAEIRSVLASYNDALNGGKTAAVLPLYTDDGTFMPPYSQSSIGKEAVRVTTARCGLPPAAETEPVTFAKEDNRLGPKN